MLEVRRALELQTVVLACDRASDEQIRGLYEAIDQQRQAPSFQESAEADVLFHQRLAAMTGNQLFELLLESVSGILRETVHRTLVQSGPAPAIDGHLKIANAIRERDRGRAHEAMLEHMDCTA
jgi:DNA-binding FadR family transcriptional regulator